MAASKAGKISLFVCNILHDLDVSQEASSVLYEDNDGAESMASAHNPTIPNRHMEVQYFALAEWVERYLL